MMQTAPDAIESLTDKQCEALELVLRHMSSKEIAQRLEISPRAVDQRLDAVRIKLGAATRLEAAKLYQRHRGVGASDCLTSEPFPLPLDLPEQQESGGSEEPGFTLHDAGCWPAEWDDEPKFTAAAEPKPIVLGKALRFGLIIAGALALMVLILVMLAVAQALEVIIP
ncbi:helix-turn-helix transcriptional regulator [Porphyrobacter sp. GA68]|uniref:helix-turn-helix domain-containing protein n=1 Tax=Porphyrobacter sp. GA68 TaxID=2883480 RepID=UPI001D186781|nr:helix-turn-helix transcriptional regulator [Porphyrobacter sp. GA68]